MTEHKTSNSSERMTNMDEASSNSPLSQRTKHHSVDNIQHSTTKSNNSDTHDNHLNQPEQLHQQPMNSKTATQQPSNNGIFNFILSSEDDCAWLLGIIIIIIITIITVTIIIALLILGLKTSNNLQLFNYKNDIKQYFTELLKN